MSKLSRIVRRVRRGLAICDGPRAYLGLELARIRGGHAQRPVRLRFKPEGPVWFRVGTTDYPTMVSCFVEGYHRPARPLPIHPVILDIGANVGYTMIDFKYHHHGARVIGVEMDAGNHALAARNVAGLAGIELVHAAIWFEDGEVSYDARANADAFAIGAPAERPSNRVTALSMASLMQRHGVEHADYVKLDIEGAEETLFRRGNLAWLQRVGQIGVELHGALPAAELIELLQKHGLHAVRSRRHWNSVEAWAAVGSP
jgi:FkbM family methyltransferase